MLVITYEDATPSHAQAIRIRKLSSKKLLTFDDIDKILLEEKGNQHEKISLTKVSILLYLLYKEDKLGDNTFKFDSFFYKNIYGIPCNKNVVMNFEAEKIYKGEINRYFCWLDAQEKMLDELMLTYGTMTPAELYTMM